MTEKEIPYQNKGDLTTGPVRGHLLRLAGPMVWAIMAIISVQLVDAYFISLLGPDKLAGISFTFPVTTLISHLVFGLNVAMSSVISRLIGKGLIEDVRRITLHGIGLAFVVSSIVAVLFYILLEPLFKWMGADNASMQVIMDYMPLWLVASVVLSIPVNANSATRAAGDTFNPSIVMTSIALINLAIAPVLIFGLFGFPRLEVTGAAIATLIAYGFGAALAIYIVAFKKRLIAMDGLHLDKFKDSMRRLLVIAIPASLGTIINPAMNTILTALIARHGPEGVAAFGVASRIEAFAMIAVIALSLGMAPLVGQNWGAGRIDRVHESIRLSMLYNFIWCLFVAAVLGIFAYQVGGFFTDDPAILHYTALYFWIVPVTYAFSNLVYGWSSAFNAMGAPQRAFAMIATKSFGLTVPAAFIAGHYYGIDGIFFAIAIVNVLAGVFFHSLSWRACQKKETATEGA
jgi:putative MATE family efflux protein